jgi:hypothetical protein
MTFPPARITDRKQAQKEEPVPTKGSDTSIDKIIRDLYPTLTNVELKHARRNLQSYFEVIGYFEQQLGSRSSRELDTESPRPTMKERSKVEEN